MMQIGREYYPAIFKIIGDAERILSDLIGSQVSLEMGVKCCQLTQAETNKLWLQNQVCAEYQVTWAEIRGKIRRDNFVNARKAYCYLAYHFLKITLKEISGDLGYHHSSIIHLRDKCADHIETKDAMAIHVKNIENKIYENIS